MRKGEIELDKGQGLLRRLGLLDATFLVIGAVLGSGIFMTSGLISARVPSPALVILVFAVGGLITVSGALSFAELGAMYPQAGGQYVYLREAYGPPSGFFFGWIFFWVIQCGGIAALAVGFADYAGIFLGGSFGRPLFHLTLAGVGWSVSPGQVLAVGAILGLTAVNSLGIRVGTVVQNALTIIRLASVAVFVLGGLGVLVSRPGGLAVGRLAVAGGRSSLAGFGLGLVAVLWAYDGWYSVSCTAEEVSDPKRNIPLSLVLGTLTVTLIYLLMNAVYFLALPLGRIAGVERVGEAAAVELFGPWGGHLLSGLIALAIFGCLSANMIFCPRVNFAMARDGLFFARLKDIHPRFRVPAKAIAAQAVWSSLLCLSGKFQALIEYVVFALVLFFAASGLALFVLRRRRPGLERPYRAWGYPVLPALFVLMNLAVFANQVVSETRRSAAGLILLALGWPAYLFWRARAKRAAGEAKGT
jgi:APA family basic amino acid/polyamine antiporter